MSLDDLITDVQDANSALKTAEFELDRESRTELAMLVAALDPEDSDELVRRAIHALFDSYVQSGKLDFNLRSEYDATYDEYLAGMSYDEMAGAGGQGLPQNEEEGRRYQY